LFSLVLGSLVHGTRQRGCKQRIKCRYEPSQQPKHRQGLIDVERNLRDYGVLAHRVQFS